MPSPSFLRRFLEKPVPEPEELGIDHAGASLPVTFIRSARARRASLRGPSRPPSAPSSAT